MRTIDEILARLRSREPGARVLRNVTAGKWIVALEALRSRVAELERLYAECLECLNESAKECGSRFTKNRALETRIRVLEAECREWRDAENSGLIAVRSDGSGCVSGDDAEALAPLDAARAATGPLEGKP